MSQSGPPADAKQAQAAALQELEAAQKRKRAIDTSLVGTPLICRVTSIDEK
jgi:chromatin modification-related protein EAF6